MQAGVEGLLHDRTRPSRVPPLPPVIGERVVALTQSDPPGETTHWTAAVMAGGPGSAFLRCTHLAFTRAPAASGTAIQTVPRPGVRPEIARYRRALCRSTRRDVDLRSSRKAKYRRSTALSPACRSRRAGRHHDTRL